MRNALPFNCVSRDALVFANLSSVLDLREPSSLSKSSSVSISFNNESIEDEPIEIIRNIKKKSVKEKNDNNINWPFCRVETLVAFSTFAGIFSTFTGTEWSLSLDATLVSLTALGLFGVDLTEEPRMVASLERSIQSFWPNNLEIEIISKYSYLEFEMSFIK